MDESFETTKVKHPRGYLAAYQNMVKPYISDEFEVVNEDRPFEFFMNRFRLMEACPKQDFIDTTGLGFDAVQPTIEWAKELGYLSETDTHWQITEKGKLFLNDLLEAFMVRKKKTNSSRFEIRDSRFEIRDLWDSRFEIPRSEIRDSRKMIKGLAFRSTLLLEESFSKRSAL